MPTPQRVSQSPSPCTAGEKVTFCIDIDGLSLPAEYEGNWDDGGQTEIRHTVTSAEDRCWDENVPNDASTGSINGPDTLEYAVAVNP